MGCRQRPGRRSRPQRQQVRVLPPTPFCKRSDETAFAHRDERFLLKLTGPEEWLHRAYEIAHEHGSGGVYPNFPDPGLDDALTAYHGPNLPRPRQVKAAYD